MSYCSSQRNSACSSSHQSKPKIGPRAARRPRGSLAIHFIIWQPSTAKSSEMPDNQSCGANKSRAPRTGGRRRNKRAASELLYGNRGPHVKTPESRCWCWCHVAARAAREMMTFAHRGVLVCGSFWRWALKESCIEGRKQQYGHIWILTQLLVQSVQP